MDRKEQILKQLAIAKRAMNKGLCHYDGISLVMDIKFADEVFNLRLDDLLNADDLNFAHDICGIQNHIDRRNKVFTDCFVPRYAGVKPE